MRTVASQTPKLKAADRYSPIRLASDTYRLILLRWGQQPSFVKIGSDSRGTGLIRVIMLLLTHRPNCVNDLDMETISAFDNRFPDDNACKAFLAAHRWPDGVRCPRCKRKEKVYAIHAKS